MTNPDPHDPAPAFNLDDLTFDRAAIVLPSQDRVRASRFSLPVPAFDGEELRYPSHYPVNMRQRDGSPHPQAGQPHPKAGRPIEDWRGQPVLRPDGSVPRGVVFFNYEDARYQGVESTGDKILLFNRPSPTQARLLEEYIGSRGGLASLASTDALKDLLAFAQQHGLDDRYDSSLAYAERSLTPLAESASGIPAYGLHLRANEMVRAVLVPGPGSVGDVSIGPEGIVCLLIAQDPQKGSREIRPISPGAFEQTYVTKEGSPARARDLPLARPVRR